MGDQAADGSQEEEGKDEGVGEGSRMTHPATRVRSKSKGWSAREEGPPTRESTRGSTTATANPLPPPRPSLTLRDERG